MKRRRHRSHTSPYLLLMLLHRTSRSHRVSIRQHSSIRQTITSTVNHRRRVKITTRPRRRQGRSQDRSHPLHRHPYRSSISSHSSGGGRSSMAHYPSQRDLRRVHRISHGRNYGIHRIRRYSRVHSRRRRRSRSYGITPHLSSRPSHHDSIYSYTHTTTVNVTGTRRRRTSGSSRTTRRK